MKRFFIRLSIVGGIFCPVLAPAFFLPIPIPQFSGGALPPSATISLTDHAVDATNASTYDFIAKSIGIAATGRQIIVGVSGTSGSQPVISSVTVGGNASTLVKSVNTVSSTGNPGVIALYIIQVDSGITATISITFTGAIRNCGIGVWAAYGLLSATPTNTYSSQANPGSISANIPGSGIAVGYDLATDTAGGISTFTWAGITEGFDETIEGGTDNVSHTGASDAFAAAQIGLTISATPSVGAADNALVVAAFR